jgi:hypothetical protein
MDACFVALGTSWSPTPRSLYPGGRSPGTHCIEGWMGPRAGLDDMDERTFLSLAIEIRPLDRPARSQSLYRLSYPFPFMV